LNKAQREYLKLFFADVNFKRSISLIQIIGKLASHSFGLSTEEDLNILIENVKRLNTTMNITLHVQTIQASIDNHEQDKMRQFPKKVSKTVNTMNYLKNEVDRVISESSVTMI